MTVQVIDGRPWAYLVGVGFVPIRAASPRAVQDLEMVVAAAQVTGLATMNVPGLEVEPDLEPEEEKRRIGFK